MTPEDRLMGAAENQTIWSQKWPEGLKRWDWPTIGLVLAIKLLVLSYGLQAIASVSLVHPNWLEIWHRWDAVHYLGLAEQGYAAVGDTRVSLVFFPLYPWLVRLTALVTSNYMVAALIVSGVASIAAGLAFRRMVAFDETEAVARNAVWFLFIFPSSFFLHIAYTESLFLSLTLGCFLAARTERWLWAGLLGAAASLTRVNGLILVPALMTEMALQYARTRRWRWSWLWLGLVPLGFLGYLWLNYEVTGDYFAFTKIMREHWFKKFAWPWSGVYDLWFRSRGLNINEGLNELIGVILTFVCAVISWFRLRASYSVWITLNWLLITSTAYVLSVPRYALTLFPIFILFSLASTGRRFLFAIVTVWSLLYLGLYTSRFAEGLWAF